MNETIEDDYFEWLLLELDPRGVSNGVVYVSSLLHNCTFRRRVGYDENRAVNGTILRREFLESEEGNYDPEEIEDLKAQECTWLEMLIALCRQLDFMYGGSVQGRFLELTGNMGLEPLFHPAPYRSRRTEEFDQGFVNVATSKVDDNRFDRQGRGGMFPLKYPVVLDQREVEIWEQHNAYFRERLEGVLWTSTS